MDWQVRGRVERGKRATLVAMLVLLSVAIDQGTKRIASDALRGSPPRSYLHDLFRLEYLENRGTFLGLGGGLPDAMRAWLLTVGLGLFLIGILAYLLLSDRMPPLAVVGGGLLLGGGAGNWLDRLLHGTVAVDFLNVGIGRVRSGVFNIADLLIETGVVLLLAGSLRRGRDDTTGSATDGAR